MFNALSSKAIYKEAMINIIVGVADAATSIGAEEMGKAVIDQLANVHFAKHFEERCLRCRGPAGLEVWGWGLKAFRRHISPAQPWLALS